MTWNIFKRFRYYLESEFAEAELRHSRTLDWFGKSLHEQHLRISQLEQLASPANNVKEAKAELRKAKQREHYHRNKNKILAVRKDVDKKLRQREYSRRHYAKKKAQAKLAEQPRFIEAA